MATMTPPDPTAPRTGPAVAAPAPPGILRRWQAGPAVPLSLCAIFLAFLALPRVRENPRLLWTFVAVSGVLAAWTAWLASAAKRLPECFRIDVVQPRRQHYIQSVVQICVYVYWGWYWRDVYHQVPLFLAQLVFLYAFDALLSWTRGRAWLLGFGPLPIVLSTNVFLWFRDDWFAWQFALVALGALGKEFLKWRREGRRTHIFNPSAFTLSVFSIVLIATASTDKTWGVEIATTIFRPPHIYLEIFLLGLVVQYFFQVTLMTFAAAAALYALNAIYTARTGVYYFVDTNISAAVFLGFHLLVTDPSTSPRTNLGKVIFGCLYGLAIWCLYWMLGRLDAPQFYDKLLPIPLLNLGVQAIDRFASSGVLGRLTRWEGAFPRRRLNLIHMGCWAALFLTMLGTGFVEAPHEGRSIAFWKQAYDEGKPDAGRKLLNMIQTRMTKDDGVAFNAMGSLRMDGRLVVRDLQEAALDFARACELGSQRGCVNVLRLYIKGGLAESQAAVSRALDEIEPDCDLYQDDGGDGCFCVGYAYESGEGRPKDPARALAFYRQAAARGNLDACKALVRNDQSTLDDLLPAAQRLAAAAQQDDAEACYWLAALYDGKNGFPRDGQQAHDLLAKACQLGLEQACTVLQRAESK
jgi:hypothetical protein